MVCLILSAVTLQLLIVRLSTQEELQVPYEVKPYKRDAEHFAPKELKDVHFLGASPVLTEGDFVLAESGAIVGEFKHRISLRLVVSWPRQNT